MRKHVSVSIFLVAALALALWPVTVRTAATAGPDRRIDSTTGATPNYRTFIAPDLKIMPCTGGNYTFLKNQAPYTFFNQDFYGVNLSYLLDVEVGLKTGTTGIKVIGSDGYQVTLSPDAMRNANTQGLFSLLAWKKGDVNKTGGRHTELDDEEGPFRLVVPQSPNVGPSPTGTPNFNLAVSAVRAIEVIPTPPGLPSVDPATVPSDEILVYGNVLNRRSFTVDQLKSIKESSGAYRWSREGVVGTEECKGIPFDYLVEDVAGVLPGATGIDVVASDTFRQSFSFEDIRLTPNGLPMLLAWYADGDLTQEPGRGPLMTVKPQTSPTDGNREFWIRNVRSIQVKPMAASDVPDVTRIPSDRVIVCGMSDPRNVPDFWYLAEGYTGGGFEEFVCIGNPNSWQTRVIVTYMIEGQDNINQELLVEPRSRVTVNVNDTVGPDKNVSATVEGYHGDSVIVERAMYWSERDGGHCAAAVSTPATDWYLAEGCTANSFETWVLLQNPGDTDANVNVMYMDQSGAVPGPALSLPPRSRKTINVADTLPNNVQVSTRVASDQPIIVERSMYWNDRRAGTCAVGLNEPGTEWYLAEGCTGGGFETWVLVQNPGTQSAKVTVKYMNENGPQAGPAFELPAGSRTSLNVADTLPGDYQVSTSVYSDRPIVAERAVYWSGRAGGHAETAVDSPRFRFLLAEGSTAGDFETWLLVQNPGSSDATVYITYLTSAGAKLRSPLTVEAGRRISINEFDDVGEDWQVSTDVHSSSPVVVERSVYWRGFAGDGSCSHGFPTW